MVKSLGEGKRDARPMENILVMVQDMCSPWWGMITTINSVYSSHGREDGEEKPVHGSELIPFCSTWPPAAAALFECTLQCPSAKLAWEWPAEPSTTEVHLSFPDVVSQTPGNTGVSSSSLQGWQFGCWAPEQEAEMLIWFLAHSQLPQCLTFIMEEPKQRHRYFYSNNKILFRCKKQLVLTRLTRFWVLLLLAQGSCISYLLFFFLFAFLTLIKWTKSLEVFRLFRGSGCPKGTRIPKLRAEGSAFLCFLQNTPQLQPEPLLQRQSCHRGAAPRSAASITLGK